MPEIPDELRWPYAMARSQVGREDYEQLTDKLDAAVAADFRKWREYEERLTQERPQVFAGSPTPKDVTTFILDHLLPQKMGLRRSNARGEKHQILNLVAMLEPYQFVGLVLLYAIRIDDRDGASRAFDILLSPSSFYLQRLEAYRKSSEGGHQKASHSRAKRAARDQRIRERRDELRESGEAIIAATAITGSVVCEGRAGGREVGQSILCQVCARAVCKEIQE